MKKNRYFRNLLHKIGRWKHKYEDGIIRSSPINNNRRIDKIRLWYQTLITNIRYKLFIKKRLDRALQDRKLEIKYYRWIWNNQKFSHRLLNQLVNIILWYPSRYCSPIDRLQYDWTRILYQADAFVNTHYGISSVTRITKVIEDPMHKYNTKKFEELDGRDKETFLLQSRQLYGKANQCNYLKI